MEEKRNTNRSTVLAPDGTCTTVLEWLPLVSAFRDTVEWVLDIAADIAREYPEEVAAVERVRTFLRARMHGFRATMELRDALFTVGLLLAAIERDLGPLPKRGGRSSDCIEIPTSCRPVHWRPRWSALGCSSSCARRPTARPRNGGTHHGEEEESQAQDEASQRCSGTVA